jgi:hypothetical protein
VKKPKDILEFVIVHETAHINEPTHSDRFIAILGEHYPTWREARAELNDPRSVRKSRTVSPAFSYAMGRASVRCTAERTSFSRIRIGAIIFNSTSISTETTAAGLGANHQTGWTGLVAKMIELYGRFDPKQLLQEGKRGAHAGGKAEK